MVPFVVTLPVLTSLLLALRSLAQAKLLPCLVEELVSAGLVDTDPDACVSSCTVRHWQLGV